MTAKWIGKRMGMGIIVLFIVSFLSFFILQAAPGSPATAFYGGNAQLLNGAEKERIGEAFSLDRPVIEQYSNWLRETLQGNLGYSYREGRPVTDILLNRLPNTLLLIGTSVMVIIAGSIAIGTLAGMKEGSWWDRGLAIVSIVSASVPAFWLGILFILFFSVTLGILPSSGTEEIGGEGGIADKLHHLLMPVAVIVITHVGIYARILQQNIKSENRSYYAMVARANGVEETEIQKGVLRNASIPYLNYIGVTIPSFFGGAIIIETLFSWSGLGQLTVTATLTKDFPLLMGCVLLIGSLVVLSILLVDVLMYAVAPKLQKGD